MDRGPQWLVMEPHRLGLAGASILTTLVVLVYGLRLMGGASIEPSSMVVGAGMTFVVSYAAVGLFVWFALHVAFSEFGPPPEQEHQRRSLVGKKKKQAAEAAGADATGIESLIQNESGLDIPAMPATDAAEPTTSETEEPA